MFLHIFTLDEDFSIKKAVWQASPKRSDSLDKPLLDLCWSQVEPQSNRHSLGFTARKPGIKQFSGAATDQTPFCNQAYTFFRWETCLRWET